MATSQVTRKFSHASQITKYIYSITLEGNTLLQIQNGGMPLFITSANLYQQTIADVHKNLSENRITTSILFSFHQTHILNLPQQNKTMKHSQEHSEFILLKIKKSSNQKHQHFMPNSLHT